MTDLSDYAEQQMRRWAFTDQAVTRPTEWWVQFYTSAPSDAGGGVQIGDRVEVTFEEAGSLLRNDALLEVTAESDWGNVVAVGVFDAETSGNLWLQKTVTPQTVVTGNVAKFVAGTMTFMLD